MKIVTALQTGQYLSTAYDFYASGLFSPSDPNMVGTSMQSGNGIYCGHLSIDGSFNLHMGRLPDRLWGTIWRTPTSSNGLSVTRGGVAPSTVYTLLLDTDGVLKVQASGQTIWKTTGPTDTSGGAYFAEIDDAGQLALWTGTPASPGEKYWSSGSDVCQLFVLPDPTLNLPIAVTLTYSDVRSGRPGSFVSTVLSDKGSGTYRWDAMLAPATDPGYLQSLPAAMTLSVSVDKSASHSIEIGLFRRVTLQLAGTSFSVPIGMGTQPTA